MRDSIALCMFLQYSSNVSLVIAVTCKKYVFAVTCNEYVGEDVGLTSVERNGLTYHTTRIKSSCIELCKCIHVPKLSFYT